MKTLDITLSAITAVALLTGCGGGSSSSSSDNNAPQVEEVDEVLQSGRFIDASVQGLGYVCQTSGRTGSTDANGIFTCNVGEAVAFYISDNYIGSALVQDTITPYTLFPNNPDAVINLAQLLQTLDSDGNPDNGITLALDRVSALEGAALNFEHEDFDLTAGALLNESLINAEAAREHLNTTLGLGSNEEHVPVETEEDTIPEDDEGVVDSGESASSEDDDTSGGSSSSHPSWELPDFEIPDDIEWEIPASSSSEGSSSSHPAWYVPTTVDIPSGVTIDVPVFTIISVDDFAASYDTAPKGQSKAYYDQICQDNHGEDAQMADWNQIEQLQNIGADMERLMSNLSLTIDGDIAFIAVDGEVDTTKTFWGLTYEGTSTIYYDASYTGTMAIDNGIEQSSTYSTTHEYPVACYVPQP